MFLQKSVPLQVKQETTNSIKLVSTHLSLKFPFKVLYYPSIYNVLIKDHPTPKQILHVTLRYNKVQSAILITIAIKAISMYTPLTLRSIKLSS